MTSPFSLRRNRQNHLANAQKAVLNVPAFIKNCGLDISPDKCWATAHTVYIHVSLYSYGLRKFGYRCSKPQTDSWERHFISQPHGVPHPLFKAETSLFLGFCRKFALTSIGAITACLKETWPREPFLVDGYVVQWQPWAHKSSCASPGVWSL